MHTREVEAVIFDMDGLMFDTERVFMRGYEAAGEALNLPDAAILTELTMGCSKEQEIRIIEERYPIPGIGIQVFNFVREYLAKELEEHSVPVMPGLYELLEYIRSKNLPAGIASGSPKKVILHHLRATGTESYIQAIAASDMVTVSKPVPTIYLLCSEMLGANPEKCLVLEDSINGILAAKRAGMIPVMVPNLVQPDAETENRLFAKLHDLSEAIPLIEKLLKK